MTRPRRAKPRRPEAAPRAGDRETRDRLCLAAVAGAHGVRGEVRLKVFAEDPASLAGYGPLTGGDGRRYEVEGVRAVKDGAVARLAGIGDRDAAQALKGLRLYVARDALPAADEEEWYHADLIGLEARTPDGEPLGTVSAVHDFGAGDLIEISSGDGGGSELVPFTRQHVPEVDIAAGVLVVVPPEAAPESDEEPDEVRDDEGQDEESGGERAGAAREKGE